MKKKFFHCASAIVASAMIFTCAAPAVYAADEAVLTLESEYLAETSELSVKGTLPKTGRTFVNIIIAPYGQDVDSATAIADDKVIVKTVQSEVSGAVDTVITMPAGQLANRYSYYLNTDSAFASGVFTTAKVADITPVLPGVNGASADTIATAVGSAATSAGLSGEGDDTAYIADYIYAVKPEGGYTAETFADAYMAAQGLSVVAEGDIDMGEYLAQYAQYLDEDYYSIYNELNADTQAAMTELYRNYPVEESFDANFDKNLFIAKFKGSESAAQTQKLVLDYLESIGYDLDDYEDIGNSVYQEKVFDNLYSDRKSVDNLDDILEGFEKEVEKQADNAEDASSGSGGSSGSGSGSKGGTTGSISTVPAVSAPVGATFADMADHWAKADVETMYARGVVSGFPDGTFRPGQNVTRAEFAKMIAVILGLDANGQSAFDDVQAGQWYTGYVAAVTKAGIVNGTSATTFEPEKYITRQDAAVMLARVLDYKGKTYPTQSKGFNDEDAVAAYAKNAVNGLANLGLINGYNGGFAPADNTTRAEAAALLLRVADYIK